MSKSYAIYIAHYGGDYTWLIRTEGEPDTLGSGDIDALGAALGEGNHQVRLIVGGPQVAVRRLSFEPQEKRHLHKLMPFQLEEDVVGDIDQFHFALARPGEKSVSVAYTEKARLEAVFDELREAGIEVAECYPAALLPEVPDAPDSDAEQAAEQDAWALHWQAGQVAVHHGPNLGFCVDARNLPLALELLLNDEQRVDSLPHLALSAPDENQLTELENALPAKLDGASTRTRIAGIWDFEPHADTLNLCQGAFSQRLPVERWWRHWRTVAMAAAAALVVYIGTLALSISELKDENLETRRQIEQVFRTVVPNGPANDAERRLRIKARELEPQTQSSQAVALMAQVLPLVDERDGISLKGAYYTGDNAELALNLQAGTFNAIETLRGAIEGAGLTAELLSSSAQGSNHSARLKITRGMP